MDEKIREDYFVLVRNKRKARGAMCKVAVLLFAFALFSTTFGLFVSYVSSSFVAEVQNILVKILCFFNVSGQVSIAASKMFVTSTAAASFLNMITVLVTVVLPAFIFSKLVKVHDGQGFEFGGKCIKGIVPLFGITQLLCTAVLLFSTAISDFLIPGAEQKMQSAVSTGTEFDVFGFVMQIICVCIVVPIAEEYAFRGVVFGYLKKFGLGFAVVASAFVFGISHATPSQGAYAFTFGIVAGIVTAITGNLKTSIVLHLLNNLTIVLQENIRLVLDKTAENIIYCIFMLFVFGFAFYGIYRFAKSDGIFDMFKNAKDSNDKELLYTPGIRDIFVFPVVVYVLIYAVSFVMEILG